MSYLQDRSIADPTINMLNALEDTKLDWFTEPDDIFMILVVNCEHGFPAFDQNSTLLGFYQCHDAPVSESAGDLVFADVKDYPPSPEVLSRVKEELEKKSKTHFVVSKRDHVTLEKMKEKVLLVYYHEQATHNDFLMG